MGKFVLVTTLHRGVFAGYLVEDESPKFVRLREARCAITFGTTKGFMELAHTGPTKKSLIGSPADIKLYDITSIADVTEEARGRWEAAS